jgi:hypothetical protein
MNEAETRQMFEWAWERWLQERGIASLVDFAAGWREALGALPFNTTCECLTCREARARYKLAVRTRASATDPAAP